MTLKSHEVTQRSCLALRALIVSLIPLGWTAVAAAQPPNASVGEAVPRDVRDVYDKGLQYLVKTQSEKGDWKDGQNGPGMTGLALMAFLASGEDPNFGIYSSNVRRAVRSIVADQDAKTGYLGNSMYHHGFGMLALAEAYGTVDDRQVWPDGKKPRSIGQALELAVRAAVTSQKKNSLGAWRYSPESSDADTSVSGSVLVGLLGGSQAPLDLNLMLRKRLTIVGTTLRARPLEDKIAATQRFASQVVPWLERSLVRPIVDSVFAFEEVRPALAHLESNEVFGKIVLSL